MNNWNQDVIREFRANAGSVGGYFEGTPLLLLHTAGAKSGRERVNPATYQDLGDGRVVVFASYSGLDTNPAWYHNVVANPDVTAEIGTEPARSPLGSRLATSAPASGRSRRRTGRSSLNTRTRPTARFP